MAPKTLEQKTVNYENDSFEVWLQKTNVISSEQGDLNRLNTQIYQPKPTSLSASQIQGGVFTQALPNGNIRVVGISTKFLRDIKPTDLICLMFPQAPTSPHNNLMDYLLEVVSVDSDTQLTVAKKYSGSLPFPNYSTSSQNLHPIVVKTPNLVDSINKTQEITHFYKRQSLIFSIGMS